MSPAETNQAKRFPLQFTIAFVFSLLFLLVGLALISYNYFESRKMAMLGANRLLARTSQHIETTVSDLYGPVRNLVDISSRALAATAVSLDDRLLSLPFLAEPLRLRPHISAVYVGYEDGDLFLVRSVDEHWQGRQGVSPPPGGRFLVQNIEHGVAGAGSETWLFYDEDLELLQRVEMGATDFDARQRNWYLEAMTSGDAITTDFYVFYTTRETGLTVARQLMHGGGAVGADLTLRDLETGLSHQKVTPSTRIAVLDPKGGVIGLSEARDEMPLEAADGSEQVLMPHISDFDDPVYDYLGKRFESENRVGREAANIADRDWLISLSELSANPERNVYLAVLIPRDELLATINRVRTNGTLMSVALLLAALALVAWISRNISRSLSSLASEAEDVREFRFNTPITVRSRIREVDDLAETMGLMKSSLQQFLDISQALSAEKDIGRVLEMVLNEAKKVSQADGGAILMMGEDHRCLEVALLSGSASGDAPDYDPIELRASPAVDGTDSVDRHTARQGTVVLIEDADQDTRFDTTDLRARHDSEEFKTKSVLSVPLQNQQDEVIGVLQLVKAAGADGRSQGFRPEVVPYVEALSSDAAVALDIRRLLKAQRDLLDSLIHMIAGAIDAKSPYTHGHCQRVPVVARLLAEAAHRTEGGRFADFELSDDGWYQLHLASWLHDCGKVTTPEYVVDKATKLETIYNRIHEIRMRFEVLWRDAEIDYHQAVAANPGDERELSSRLQKRHAEITADFGRIARFNLGDEFMPPEEMAEIRRIGSQTWTRHLDDRLGLSHGELLQREGPSPLLPVEEQVLADKPEHIVPRPAGQNPFGDQPHGFRMEVPEHQYNRGELHNLSIQRGTLTAEERFKINEHVVQTIRMLEQLPFPRELRQVANWAGNHHEKLDGTGYPRRLEAEDLSVPERIMAIADIFEALTARDRPYSAPRPMSKALGIMGSMCAEGHLCPELFELFLKSGVYLEYGKEHLDPQQLDDVDIDSIIGALPS